MAKRDGVDDDPMRALLQALLAMAGVAVAVGLVIGLVAATVLGRSDDGSTGRAQAKASLYMPDYQPTEDAGDDEWPDLPEIEQSDSPDPAEEPVEEESPRGDKITLFGAPQAVSPGERINFNGVYIDGEGVSLQIQRREGSTWTDFPVTVAVRGGVFSTWIQTSRPGEQEFRVLDPETERTSNVVTITIG